MLSAQRQPFKCRRKILRRFCKVRRGRARGATSNIALKEPRLTPRLTLNTSFFGPLTTMKKRPRIVTWKVRMLNLRNI
jgi:hypothetical protein